MLAVGPGLDLASGHRHRHRVRAKLAQETRDIARPQGSRPYRRREDRSRSTPTRRVPTHTVPPSASCSKSFRRLGSHRPDGPHHIRPTVFATRRQRLRRKSAPCGTSRIRIGPSRARLSCAWSLRRRQETADVLRRGALAPRGPFHNSPLPNGRRSRREPTFGSRNGTGFTGTIELPIVEFVVDVLGSYLTQLVDERPRQPGVLEEVERLALGVRECLTGMLDQHLVVGGTHQPSRRGVVNELFGEKALSQLQSSTPSGAVRRSPTMEPKAGTFRFTHPPILVRWRQRTTME